MRVSQSMYMEVRGQLDGLFSPPTVLCALRTEQVVRLSLAASTFTSAQSVDRLN